MTTKNTENLTENMIRALHMEAGIAGDAAMCTMCCAALRGEAYGRQACADAINAARAMDDEAVFVKVVSK